MKELIAYCGLDCGQCDARRATLEDDNALREKTAKLWSELNHAPITPEMIEGMGGRTEGVKTPFCEALCPIRQCALKKGVPTCGSCPRLERCETVAAIIANNGEARRNLTLEE